MFARRFDASGNAVGSDFVVNTYTTGDQYGRLRAGRPRRPRQFRRHLAEPRRRQLRTASLPSASALRAPAAAPSSASTPTPRATRIGRRSPPMRWATSSSPGTAAARTGATSGSSPSASAAWGPPRSPSTRAGNRVLEPGETVDVRPSWRNFNGAAQTFSGTLTNITGPAGATYTITDAAGDYGTVANGATAAVHRLLRGLGVQPDHASGGALGRRGGREHPSRRAGPAEAVAAARGRAASPTCPPRAASIASSRRCCTTA